MRIKITFVADKLPILYRHRFMALIKETLRRSNDGHKQKLYPDKELKKEVVKPFSFSVILPHSKTRHEEEFQISKKPAPTATDTVFYFAQNTSISMFISSSDYEFITALYNGLIDFKEKNEDFRFNDDIKLTFQRVFMLNEKKIISDEVIFKTLSPILIEKQIIETTGNKEKKTDKYILPSIDAYASDEAFNSIFNNIHNGILEDIRAENGIKGHGLYRQLEFIPIKLKKQVVKHTLKGFWTKNPDKPVMKFTCFEGCFKLKGDPRDLQMLYQIGIGLRTGQGFGMVEVV